MKSEIGDLHFVVLSTSQHKCHVCLGLLKQRRNHKKKLDDLNDDLLRQYREKARAAKGVRDLQLKRNCLSSAFVVVC